MDGREHVAKLFVEAACLNVLTQRRLQSPTPLHQVQRTQPLRPQQGCAGATSAQSGVAAGRMLVIRFFVLAVYLNVYPQLHLLLRQVHLQISVQLLPRQGCACALLVMYSSAVGRRLVMNSSAMVADQSAHTQPRSQQPQPT